MTYAAAGPGFALPEVSSPVEVRFGECVPQSRLTAFFRIFMVIPQIVVLYFVGIAAAVVLIIGWFGALFTGRLPQFAVEFLSGYLRWATRVFAYAYFLTGVYPPFSLQSVPEYPVDVWVQSGRLNRWSVLFRFILVVPAAIAATVIIYGLGIFGIVLWAATVILGRTPESFFDATAAAVRYYARYAGFYSMLTSVYPAAVYGDGKREEATPAGQWDPAPAPAAWPPVPQGAAPAWPTPTPGTVLPTPPPPAGGIRPLPPPPIGLPPLGAPPIDPPPAPAPAYGVPPLGAPPTAPPPAPAPAYGVPPTGAPASAPPPAPAPAYGLPPLGAPPTAPPPAPAPAYGVPPTGAPASAPPPAPATAYGVPPTGAPAYGPPPVAAPMVEPPVAWSPWRLLLSKGGRVLLTVYIVLGAVGYVGYVVTVSAATHGNQNAVNAQNQAVDAYNALSKESTTFSNATNACTQQSGSSASQVQCLEAADTALGAALTTYASQLGAISYPSSVVSHAAAAQAAAVHAAAVVDQVAGVGSDAQTYGNAVQAAGLSTVLGQVDSTFNALNSALQSA